MLAGLPYKKGCCGRCENDDVDTSYANISLPVRSSGLAIQAIFTQYHMMSSCPSGMPIFLCEDCVTTLEQLLEAYFSGTKN